MFRGKRAAGVSVLAGSLAAACVGVVGGVAHADTGKGPGACVSDLLGNVTCSQKFQGPIPEGGVIPHHETCAPVQPVTLPSVLSRGEMKLGPEVTCSPTTTGAVDEADGGLESLGLPH